MPTEPRDIIKCAVGSFLAVGVFFAVVHLTALLVRVFA